MLPRGFWCQHSTEGHRTHPETGCEDTKPGGTHESLASPGTSSRQSQLLHCHPGVMPWAMVMPGLAQGIPALLGLLWVTSGAVLGDTGAAAGICSHLLLPWLVVLTCLTHTPGISFSSL